MLYYFYLLLILTSAAQLYCQDDGPEMAQKQSIEFVVQEIQDDDDFFAEIDALTDDDAEHAKKMEQIKQEQPPSFLMVQLRYIGIALILKYIALRGYIQTGYEALIERFKHITQKR